LWAALGVGLMLKGPVILLVNWGTILALLLMERRARWLRRLHASWGVPLMLLIVVPWCVAIWVVSHGSFFSNSVGTNFLGKVANGQQAHGLPPGYHLLAFALAFWPGSLLAVLAIPYVWKQRRDPRVRFLLAWILPTWIVFEAIATKLPHYVMPTYPAIACLTAAAALTPGAWSRHTAWRWVARIYSLIWIAVAVALAVAGPALLWRLQGQVSAWAIAGGLGALTCALLMLAMLKRHRLMQALGCAYGAALLIYASTYLVVIPGLRTVWLAPRIAQLVAEVRPCPTSVVASSSFSEPSLVFLVGERTMLVDAQAAAQHVIQDPACGLALIGSPEEAAFRAGLQADGMTPRENGWI
jgi:4-amino-4-deoxy-L-arabinose transferase-like glycosyltransferase